MNRFPINVAALIIFSIINITSSVFAQNTISLQLNPKKTHDLEVTLNQSGVYEINITGNDPYIFTQPFDQPLDPARHQILAFEYFSLKPIGALQIFMGPEISENNSITGDELGSREGWSAYSVDLHILPTRKCSKTVHFSAWIGEDKPIVHCNCVALSFGHAMNERRKCSQPINKSNSIERLWTVNWLHI